MQILLLVLIKKIVSIQNVMYLSKNDILYNFIYKCIKTLNFSDISLHTFLQST